MGNVLRIGALISGSGTNLKAIIDACSNGRVNGEVVSVGSDNPKASGFQWAQAKQIPTYHVDYKEITRQYRNDPSQLFLPDGCNVEELITTSQIVSSGQSYDQLLAFFTTRMVAEKRLLENMADHPFDLLVLAGFMRNLTPYFIDSVNTNPLKPRIMNIHPSLLPSFGGVDGYGDTFRYGCKVGGCTVHFVDYGEDTGPIIAQKAFEIHPDDTLETIRKRGLEIEWQLYPHCIELFAQNRLQFETITHRSPGGKELKRTIVKISQSERKNLK